MTLFIILMLIVYMVSCQEKTTITSEDIQKVRQEYLKKHQDSMRLYDALYIARQKRHNQWLEMMKQIEENQNKKAD